jgi:hypothetical protein
MTEELRTAKIRLELTECQKLQIREATGRQVNSLELRLQGLPEPAAPPESVLSQTGSSTNDRYGNTLR